MGCLFTPVGRQAGFPGFSDVPPCFREASRRDNRTPGSSLRSANRPSLPTGPCSPSTGKPASAPQHRDPSTGKPASAPRGLRSPGATEAPPRSHRPPITSPDHSEFGLAGDAAPTRPANRPRLRSTAASRPIRQAGPDRFEPPRGPSAELRPPAPRGRQPARAPQRGGLQGGRRTGFHALPRVPPPRRRRTVDRDAASPVPSTARHHRRSGSTEQSRPSAPTEAGLPASQVAVSFGLYKVSSTEASAPTLRRARDSLELGCPSKHQRHGSDWVWPSPLHLQPCPPGPEGLGGWLVASFRHRLVRVRNELGTTVSPGLSLSLRVSSSELPSATSGPKTERPVGLPS